MTTPTKTDIDHFIHEVIRAEPSRITERTCLTCPNWHPHGDQGQGLCHNPPRWTTGRTHAIQSCLNHSVPANKGGN